MGTLETSPVGTNGNDFGQRLREMRDARKWSQTKLAQEMKVSTVTVNNLENGHTLPKFDTLLKLAGAFGIDVSEFFKAPAA